MYSQITSYSQVKITEEKCYLQSPTNITFLQHHNMYLISERTYNRVGVYNINMKLQVKNPENKCNLIK